MRIESLKALFELSSISSNLKTSPEGAKFIRTLAVSIWLKELGFIQIEEILSWMDAETLTILSLSFESFILLISFFISFLSIENFWFLSSVPESSIFLFTLALSIFSVLLDGKLEEFFDDLLIWSNS